MATQLEITGNQAEINGALSLAFVMVMDILQVMSPNISGDPRFMVLKRVIKETPGRRPPGCRASDQQIADAQEALSPDFPDFNAEFDSFWLELAGNQP